jgi:pimeloyl-ACP methyl ester carboxylesterase
MPVAHLNDTELFYVEVGEGLPCLVMHGGLGEDHSALHPWLDPLGDVMRLVYYDHRGNGRSGRPPTETITFEQLCSDADALREHLGFEEVAVLGYSFGGFVALEFALRYPEHLGHLILLDTAPTLNYAEEIEANARRKGATGEQLEAFDASTEDGSWRLWKLMEPLYFHTPRCEPGRARDGQDGHQRRGRRDGRCYRRGLGSHPSPGRHPRAHAHPGGHGRLRVPSLTSEDHA